MIRWKHNSKQPKHMEIEKFRVIKRVPKIYISKKFLKERESNEQGCYKILFIIKYYKYYMN